MFDIIALIWTISVFVCLLASPYLLWKATNLWQGIFRRFFGYEMKLLVTAWSILIVVIASLLPIYNTLLGLKMLKKAKFLYYSNYEES